jgi:nitrogen fixation/metabolism regulation signal transduction histidine kinase
MLVRAVPVPFIAGNRTEVVHARFLVTHPQTELLALRARLDRWLLIVGIATGLLAVLIASGLSARMSRPLAELARKTERLDLDRLDVDFSTTRRDEIGALSRLLGAMTDRLRAGAVRIKDAERRATIGDLARQVNHDIKNGLTPLRNVFRHLDQVAADTPEHLPTIFGERKATLD